MRTTLITTFAIAVMVFAFNANPVMAGALGNLWSSNNQVDELKDPDEVEVAGMTMDEKVQQDEDDWNNFILRQMFAGMTMDEKVKQDEDDWNNYILQQMFALPHSPTGECEPYTVDAYCPSGSQDERDIEQREFAGSDRQRDTFSQAGVTLGGLPGGTAENEEEESSNDRVLNTGNY